MQKLGMLCLLCLFCSCDWLATRDTTTQKLVEAEMKGIDWNEVDQYPHFEGCDESADKTAQRLCFEETMLGHFSATLKEFEFIVDHPVDDTLYLDFLVDRQGKITILDMERNSVIRRQIPEFDGVISQSLKTLPKLAPALKRGMPVSAKFRIPLVVKTD